MSENKSSRKQYALLFLLATTVFTVVVLLAINWFSGVFLPLVQLVGMPITEDAFAKFILVFVVSVSLALRFADFACKPLKLPKINIGNKNGRQTAKAQNGQ